MTNYKIEGKIDSRNTGIDWLKFLAVFLVMNSHMDNCYPYYEFLSTGGAIGDALFFFSSGFTLFLGRDMPFDQWYKRRINRIYPSIFAVSIITYLVWHFEENIGDILIGKRYWFIGTIMIYYIFLYPLKKINNDKIINWVFLGLLFLIIALFFVKWKGQVPLYSGGGYRSLVFFLFILQGAIMGKHANSFKCKWWHLPTMLIAVGLWYSLFYIGANSMIIVISIIPLLYITYSSYCICNSKILAKIYNTRVVGGGIFIISQLCLEVYLIQKFIFTDKYNNIFPLNIVLLMLAVILAAYIAKMFAEFISQTFKTEPYEWKKLILKRKM